MTRLRKRSLCLTMTVWALLAPVAAGAAGSQDPERPAAAAWPQPVAALQDLVQEWLLRVFEPRDGTGTPPAAPPAPAGETPSRISASGEAHPEFDPDG